MKMPLRLDGVSYPRVWGYTHVRHIEGVPFVIIGGHGNEVVVAVDNIQFAIPCSECPTERDVLIRDGDFDEVFATMGDEEQEFRG
jgi:hypothetical protein